MSPPHQQGKKQWVISVIEAHSQISDLLAEDETSNIIPGLQELVSGARTF